MFKIEIEDGREAPLPSIYKIELRIYAKESGAQDQDRYPHENKMYDEQLMLNICLDLL